ncbi:MAG TPA: phospholipase D-like domain-containing protein [Candidatus Saccharimonadales bacterium]
MDNFQLLKAEDYYQKLLTEVPKAKKRIVIAAMVVLWGERTAPIFIMLQDALKRGVEVTILVDNFTRMTRLLGLKSTSSAGKERVRQTFRTLENLSAQGAKVCNFGKIGFPPQKGRCHVKVSIVDDTSFAFGGVNFNDESLDNIDYMLLRKDSEIADCLEQLVKKICTTRPPLTDGEVELNKDIAVLFDGGRPGRSLIYERACELAAQAQRIYFAGQMTPSGQLARLLRETDSTIYFNRPEQMAPLESIAQAFDQQKYRVENAYTGTEYIHAKLILFEMPGGRKALLSGSHNFSYRGVSFGTQEICLYSKNASLWTKLHDYVQKHIAKAR